ncbi:MAG: transcription termination/antitermination NusG family protein [Pseudomonadota bacterium]
MTTDQASDHPQPSRHAEAECRTPPHGTPDMLWYLAQLRPNQLNRAWCNLERLGYECFMPRQHATQRKGRQIAPRRVPLFPGYIFLSLKPKQAWRPVNGTFGVVRLVMRDAVTPQPVPEAVMAELLARTGKDGMLLPPINLVPGETVRLQAGPMAGLLAQVEQLDGPGRVRVLLELMGQAVRATLPSAYVERLAS